MAVRRAARSGGRGGDGIPAVRPHRARLSAALAATAVALGVVAYPLAAAEGLEKLVALAGGLGLVFLAVALARASADLLPWAVAALAGQYGAWLPLARTGIDSRAPLVGAGLVLVAELAYWSFELAREAVPEHDVVLKRVLGLLGVAALAIATGAAVLAVSTVPAGSSVVLELLGVAGAVALLGLLARLAWRARDAPRT